MTTQLTPQQSFEEKLKDRIRENIGDLMPDALLSQMIARAMSEFNMRIPAEPHRDADLVLSWAADEIERLTREVERLREAVSNALDDVLSDEAMPAHKVALLRAALSGGEHE